MKKFILFYLEDCPYRHYARRAMKELISEDKKYAADIEWVEESKRPEVAAKYDYYYVPTLFCGAEKLYEARPGQSFEEVKVCLKEALDRAL